MTKAWLILWLRFGGYGTIAAIGLATVRLTVLLPARFDDVATLYAILAVVAAGVWWSRVPDPQS